tara:strand:- start:348 stop:1424 length:1077 start_codon:yes stop_codon:yes gene_type:complete
MLKARRDFLYKVKDIKKLKGLEIGPLNKPLMKKEDTEKGGKISYLDHLSREELIHKYRDDKSINVDEIVPVDYVCRDGNITGAVAGKVFDYVVASHVIEHAPNLLRFLLEVEHILKPGGYFIIIVPDKRFTFDVDRPITTFGEVLERFLQKITQPCIASVYNHFSMATHAKAHNIWHGIVDPVDSRLLVSEKFAWDAAQKVFEQSEYYDVHVNVFTPASFFSILRRATLHKLTFFEVEYFRDTEIGQLEFMVLLKKRTNVSVGSDDKDFAGVFPKIDMEGHLSPYMPQVRSLSAALENISENNLKLNNELEELKSNSFKRIKDLEGKVEIAQKMLDRKSVKLILLLLDRLYGFFRKRE